MTFRLGDLNTGLKGRPCWRKRHYPSEGAAKAHLRSMLKMKARKDPSTFKKDPTRLNVYPCACGDGYCVGHRGRETA